MSDADVWNTPSSTTQRGGGTVANFLAGAAEGLTSLPEAALSVFGGNLWSAADRIIMVRDPNVVIAAKKAGVTPEQLVEQAIHAQSATHLANTALGPANPENVPAGNANERVIRSVGQAMSGLLVPGGEAMTVGKLLRSGVTLAAAGAGSGLAREAAPEQFKPLAALGGAVLGGMVTGGLIGSGESAANAGGRTMAAARAGASEDAAATEAAQVLQTRASSPATVRDMLANGPEVRVPGSKPTTFQQTGDVGLGELEREVATRNPGAFAERRGAQNAARVTSLGDIQQGADPADVQSFLKGHFDALDQDASAHADNLIAQARDRTQALGGMGTPEVYGEQTRSALSAAEDMARTQERGLWQAIDPNGDMTGNVTATKTAAREIADSLPKTAKPMVGEESDIFDVASSLPKVAPISDLIALRSRVSTELRNELVANGRSPAYARLSQLRGAIQDNLSKTIADQVGEENQAQEAGGVTGRIQKWLDDYRTERQQAALGAGGQEGAGAVPGSGAAAAPGPDGTIVPAPRGSGGGSGAEGLSGDAPTFDAAAAARLTAATEATKARAQTFGLAPISNVLTKAGPSDVFRMPEVAVPAKFFHPGPTGFSDMQAFLRAAGEDQGMPIIQDYAASSLRRAALRDDGTLDPAKFYRWQAQHQDALRAFPAETRAAFADSASASRAASEALRAREIALKEAEAGRLGKLMNADPADVTAIVGQALESRVAVGEMRRLADAVQGDAFAIAGLRQAVADHIASRYLSNTESGTSGVSQIKADAFQTLIRQKRAALATVFSPSEIANMEAIAADIQRANRSITAVKIPGSSNTAQDLYGLAAKPSRGARSFLDVLAGSAGFLAHGPIGAAIGAAGAELFQALRTRGIDRVDQLITDAMLNPEVARELLKRVPANWSAPSAMPLVGALRRAGNASSLAVVATNHQKPPASP